MSSFLLPCACGQRMKVSTAQAGQSIRCACGAQLEVPTLRGLRALPQANERGDGQRATARAWSNRHRVAFLLVLASLCSLAASGYLAAKLPAAPIVLTPQEIATRFTSSSPAQVYEVYQDLRKGLPSTASGQISINDQRRFILWEIVIALAVSGLGLAASTGILLKGRKQNR
jgi:hypothetical protein